MNVRFKPNKMSYFIALCGQDSVDSYDYFGSKFKFIFKIIPLSLSIAMLIIFCLKVDEKNWFIVGNYTVIIPTFVSLIECFIKRKRMMHLLISMRNTITYLETNMNVKVPIDEFFRKFNRKIMFGLSFTILTVLVKLFIAAPNTNILDMNLVYVSFIYNYAAVSNAVLHIDLFRCIFASIYQRLEPSTAISVHRYLIVKKNLKELHTTLRQVKEFHFRICVIGKEINYCFQWFLLFVLFNSAFIVLAQTWGFVQYLDVWKNIKKLLFLRNTFEFALISFHIHLTENIFLFSYRVNL